MQDQGLTSWSPSFGQVYARWKTVFAGLIGSCACTILACAALLASSGSSTLQLQGIQQAWGQLCAVAVPAILRTPAAQLYVTLICAAITCAYAVIIQVSAGQRFMPALGAADRHNAPWAPVRGELNSPVQPKDYVHPGMKEMEITAIAEPAVNITAGQARKTTFPAQCQPFFADASEDITDVVRTSLAGPRVPANTGTLPWPSALVWPVSPDTVDGAITTPASDSNSITPAVPATTAAIVAALPSTLAAPPQPRVPEPESPLPSTTSARAAELAASAVAPGGIDAPRRTAAQSRSQRREELAALRREGLLTFGQAARRPSTPVAAPAAFFAVAADTVAPGWETSPLAAATARAGAVAAETLALAATPFTPLFSVENGPVAFQAPTIRSRYDPMVSLMALSPPAQRPAWDPVASVRHAEAPTRAAFARSILDPMSQIAAACAPTGGVTWDPLQRLRRATAPLRATYRPFLLDPLSYVTLARVPSGGTTWDPLQRLKQAVPPKRATMGKSVLDPLSHMASVRIPQGGKSWDPVHALVNSQAPRGGKSWDPIHTAVRARVPKHRTVWDPVHALHIAQAPTGRSMLDPVHALTRMDVPRHPAHMDPMSTLRKLSQPTGTPKWDPLRLLREARSASVDVIAPA